MILRIVFQIHLEQLDQLIQQVLVFNELLIVDQTDILNMRYHIVFIHGLLHLKQRTLVQIFVEGIKLYKDMIDY